MWNLKEICNKSCREQTVVYQCYQYGGHPADSDGKESAWNAEDTGSIPGLERPPGEGNGNPEQYSHLRNPMDRGAW